MDLAPITAIAVKHIKAILNEAILFQEGTPALLVADDDSPLARLLNEAYQRVLPKASVIAFNSQSQEAIIDAFNQLPAGSLVVLIQTSSFRLNAFRIRVELFNQQLKVIEHPHLGRMQGDEIAYYIDALAYDSDYFHTVGHALKRYIDNATTARLDSEGAVLFFSSGLESAKLNIGDYREMKNVGGQFPIGEVFTEAKDLEAVHGSVNIHAFGDTSFRVHKLDKPITLQVEKGRVIAVQNDIPEFEAVLESIRVEEGEVWVRELGFGLNRAFTHDRLVADIGTYERMCGIHLSLGAKHSMYRKPQFTRSTAKYHVDVFAITQAVWLDDRLVYKDGAWVI